MATVMELHVLFIQNDESYDGQSAPEAVLVIDEYSYSEDPEAWDQEVQKTIALHGAIKAAKVLKIRVDQDKIRKILLESPVIDGELVT